MTRAAVANTLLLVCAMAAVPYTSGRVDASRGEFTAERESLTVWTGKDVSTTAQLFM